MTWRIEPLPRNGPIFDGAIAVYAEAFALPPYSDPDRGIEVGRRLKQVEWARKGFAGLVAVEDGAVVGMAYGYTGLPGQWWHDIVNSRLDYRNRRWLADSFELVEVAVAPAHQSRGIGRALVNALLEGRSERTCVLSTRVDSRAHHLYAELGFEQLAEISFARNGAQFYVMGKRLNDAPLPARRTFSRLWPLR